MEVRFSPGRSDLIDDRLRPAKTLKDSTVRKLGLSYLTTGENHDYLADELLGVSREEETSLFEAAQSVFDLMRELALELANDERALLELGLPQVAIPLVQWSARHEADDYLVGRFDFAGGLKGMPPKLLEFNADTCSLMPETAHLQPAVLKRNRLKPLTNQLFSALSERLRTIAGGGSPGLLVSTLGYPEDKLNADLIGDAALAARWKPVDNQELQYIHFDPEQAILIEMGPEQYKAYSTLYHAYPWDFIAFEEPELMQLLSEMIMDKRVKLLNPAWSMIMQSKALLSRLWARHPHHPLLLATYDTPDRLPRYQYARKPIFGRTGDNLAIFQGAAYPLAERGGEYGNQPVVYQEVAPFNQDDEKYRYQLSVFFTDRPCALCCRRLDEWIIDDDAEFVSLFVQ